MFCVKIEVIGGKLAQLGWWELRFLFQKLLENHTMSKFSKNINTNWDLWLPIVFIPYSKLNKLSNKPFFKAIRLLFTEIDFSAIELMRTTLRDSRFDLNYSSKKIFFHKLVVNYSWNFFWEVLNISANNVHDKITISFLVL